MTRFRPHVWGFFFHSREHYHYRGSRATVFVPMFGDSFFTNVTTAIIAVPLEFSSPCLGILFHGRYPVPHKSGERDVFVPMFGDSFFTSASLMTLGTW